MVDVGRVPASGSDSEGATLRAVATADAELSRAVAAAEAAGVGTEYGVSAGAVQGGDSETMQKASGVVAEKAGKALEGLSLSSSTWTELLD